MDSLKDKIVSAHIAANYPNARIVEWDDADSNLKFYSAKDLKNADDGWFPLCARLDEATGTVIYGGRDKVLHTYTEGETGAGKTTRFAMQSIRALSCTKGKPSFLVMDIHGELVENLYDHLKENGYNIRILNCDDPSRSDTYNPFLTIANRCAASGVLDNQTINEVRRIAEIIQPLETLKDPIWDQGAQAYTNGWILDKLEDLINGEIQPEQITIYNIIENHYWLRQKLMEVSDSRTGIADLLKIPHFMKKGAKALSVQKMMAVTNNAERTRMSYFGVIENHYDSFGQPTLYQLSSSSTIRIDSFIEEPTAIFIQSGSTRIADDLLSLMTNEIYNTVVRKGRESATKLLPRKIHCFLDEFANCNIADGPEFIRMLTTSRKFGMYWHMLLQCDAQLDRKFDPDMARIIRANCTEIFMGSQDHDTLVRFSRSCGEKTVEALSSQISQQGPVLTTVDLITPDKLSLTEEGYIYVKSNRNPLLLSYIEAFYKCPEFKPNADILSVYPVNRFDYTCTYFTPDDITPEINRNEFILLRYIHDSGTVSLESLPDALPEDAANTLSVLQNLEKKRFVSVLHREKQVTSTISDSAYQFLLAKYKDIPRQPVITALTEDEYELLSFIRGRTVTFLRVIQKNFKDMDHEAVIKQLLAKNLVFLAPSGAIKVTVNNGLYQKLLQRCGKLADFQLIDRYYSVFRDCIKSHPDYPNIDLSDLKKITCIPRCIHNYVQHFTAMEAYETEYPFPGVPKFMEEIKRMFLNAHDFEDTAAWHRAIKEEFAIGFGLTFLPEIVRNCYRDVGSDLLSHNVKWLKQLRDELNSSTDTE